MNVKNFNIIFMLIAGLIVAIISLIQKYSLTKFSYTMIIVLAVFFIIGTMIKGVVNSVVYSLKQKEMDAQIEKIEENIDDDKQKDQSNDEQINEEKELEQSDNNNSVIENT